VHERADANSNDNGAHANANINGAQAAVVVSDRELGGGRDRGVRNRPWLRMGPDGW
jgi:hypothetical protein